MRLTSALVVAAVLTPGPAASARDNSKGNHSLPGVQPPPAVLAFTSSPTSEELFRAHVFEEPLVPVGGEPSAGDNAALAQALARFAQRQGQDDFLALTDYLKSQPQSPWRAALLVNLGIEYYRSAYYSRAIEAWVEAWALARDAKDLRGKALGDRAVGELAYMYGRICHVVGRLTQQFQTWGRLQGCLIEIAVPGDKDRADRRRAGRASPDEGAAGNFVPLWSTSFAQD